MCCESASLDFTGQDLSGPRAYALMSSSSDVRRRMNDCLSVKAEYFLQLKHKQNWHALKDDRCLAEVPEGESSLRYLAVCGGVLLFQ